MTFHPETPAGHLKYQMTRFSVVLIDTYKIFTSV